MSLNINVGGVWKDTNEVYINNSGTWVRCGEIYINVGGTWKPTLYVAGSQTFNSAGSYTFTAPAGVYSVTVSYPTTTGIASSVLSVVPFQTYAVTIGNYGSGSSISSVSAPAYSSQIFSFSGNVDDRDFFSVQCLTATAKTYTGTGKAANHISGAAAAGITLNEYTEGFHGDLTSTITVSTLPSATVLNPVRVVGTYISGRYQYELIQQQPTSGNSYTGIWTPYDPGGSEGYYNYYITFQQIVPITVSW